MHFPAAGPAFRREGFSSQALYQFCPAEEFNDVHEDHCREQRKQCPDHVIHRFLQSLKVAEPRLSNRLLQLSMKEFSQRKWSVSMDSWT